MRKIDINDDDEALEFAKRAAKSFAKNKQYYTFTDSEIETGCLFAIRFGFRDGCVVVFRLDEDFEPIEYQQLVTRYIEEGE